MRRQSNEMFIGAPFVKAAIDAITTSNSRQARVSKMSLRAGGSKEHKSKAPETIGASVLVQTNDNTLDLRGLRVDEALSKLADFLNAAVFAGTSPLLVIHGHGTGALKSAVREELSGSDYAIEFRPGQRQEGGDGVTVIFLK